MKIKIDFKKFFSNSGTKIELRYVRQIDEDKVPILVVKEKFNLYDDIQTYKDDNNIYKILASVSNDISKLDFNKGVYIDVSKLPDNYNDMMNMSYMIKSDFDSLPQNYKEALQNNFNLFFGLAMQGKVKDFINAVDNKDNAKAKELLKSDSSNNKQDSQVDNSSNNKQDSQVDNGGDKNV